MTASSASGTSQRPLWEQDWWKLPEYRTGELFLPGQSRLDAASQSLLQEIAQAADRRMLDVPPMPESCRQAMRLLRASDPDFGAIERCIARDPVLSAQILRSSNSALYGAHTTIDTVMRAISFLGLHRVREIVMKLVMRQVTAEFRARQHAGMEWRFAVHCATISKLLGRRFRVNEEQCYVAGLLQDIGRLPILIALEARGALPETPEQDGVADIILECLHRGVGHQVGLDWEQPPSVLDAIKNHITGRLEGEDTPAQFAATRVSEAASDLCIALGLGRFRRGFDLFEAPSLIDLGFSADELETWLAEDLRDMLGRLAAE